MHLAEQTGQTKLSRGKKKPDKKRLTPPKLWKSCKILLSEKLRIPVVIDPIFGAQNNGDLLTTETNVWSSFL